MGCCVRSLPLPQRKSSAPQYLSQPQQMRSGCAGDTGIRRTMFADVSLARPYIEPCWACSYTQALATSQGIYGSTTSDCCLDSAACSSVWELRSEFQAHLYGGSLWETL